MIVTSEYADLKLTFELHDKLLQIARKMSCSYYFAFLVIIAAGYLLMKVILDNTNVEIVH
jgi:hypothetical protein